MLTPGDAPALGHGRGVGISCAEDRYEEPLSDIGPGGVFPDYSLPDHTGTVRTPSELQGRDPLILLLARGVSPRTAGDGHPDSTSPPAAKIGRAAVAAVDNRDALQGADAVVLALRFAVLDGLIDEIADPLTDKLVAVPSNSVAVDAHGMVSRLLPKGQSSGAVVAGWSPAGACLAVAFGTLSADLFESSSNRSPEPAVLFYATDDDRAGEGVGRLIRTAGFEPVKRRARSLAGRPCCRDRTQAATRSWPRRVPARQRTRVSTASHLTPRSSSPDCNSD